MTNSNAAWSPEEAATKPASAGSGASSAKASTTTRSAEWSVRGPTDGKRATAQNARNAAPIAKRNRIDVEQP
jgi:hypothetical protein